MCEEDIEPDARICSRHFPSGDVKHAPIMTVGKCLPHLSKGG